METEKLPEVDAENFITELKKKRDIRLKLSALAAVVLGVLTAVEFRSWLTAEKMVGATILKSEVFSSGRGLGSDTYGLDVMYKKTIYHGKISKKLLYGSFLKGRKIDLRVHSGGDYYAQFYYDSFFMEFYPLFLLWGVLGAFVLFVCIQRRRRHYDYA